LGIRYFDAARSYGGGEEFLGRWILAAKVTDPRVVISSKWGYRYVADWRIDAAVHEVKDHSLERLNTQYEETRSRLGRHLDIYQIHSATSDSGVLDNAAVLDRLASLRADGLTIGLSTSGPQQAMTIRRALGIERDGERLFSTVQTTWNLLEPSAGDALAAAHEAGMGVIIKESVANGRLTDRDKSTAAPIIATAPEYNVDAVAIAAILRQPWADTVVSGAATIEQLESNLGAFDVPPEVIDGLPDMAEDPAEYWHIRSGLKWT
jgi:aryl-alcohol dehydrogenase-like predicted oxidoreductase